MNFGEVRASTAGQGLAPSYVTRERVAWLEELVHRFGPGRVGGWQEPPAAWTLAAWRARRQGAAVEQLLS